MSFTRFKGISLLFILFFGLVILPGARLQASEPDAVNKKIAEKYKKMNEASRAFMLEYFDERLNRLGRGQNYEAQREFQKELYQYWLASRGTAFGHEVAEKLFRHYTFYQGRTANIWAVYFWESQHSKSKVKQLESWYNILSPLNGDISVFYEKVSEEDFQLRLTYTQRIPFRQANQAKIEVFAVDRDASLNQQLKLNRAVPGELTRKGKLVFTQTFGDYSSNGYRDRGSQFSRSWPITLKPGSYLARITAMGKTYYREVQVDDLQVILTPMGSEYLLHVFSDMYPKTKQVKIHLLDLADAKQGKHETWRSHAIKNYNIKTHEPFMVKLPRGKDYKNYRLLLESSHGVEIMTLYQEPRYKTRYQVTTDRTLYRPGHEIKFKVLRRDYDQGAIRRPAQKKVKLVLKEEGRRGRIMRSKELNWSPQGTLEASFKIGETWNSGSYHIGILEDPDDASNTTENNEVTYDFQHEVEVLAYRKSDLKAEIKVLSFEKGVMRVRVDASYLAGGSVNDAAAFVSLKGKNSWYRSSFASDDLVYEALPVELRLPTRPKRAWFANLKAEEYQFRRQGIFGDYIDDYDGYREEISSRDVEMASGSKVVKLYIHPDREGQSIEDYLSQYSELRLKVVVEDQIGQLAQQIITLPVQGHDAQPVIHVSTDQITYGHEDQILVTLKCKDSNAKPLRNREVKLLIDQLVDIRVGDSESGLFGGDGKITNRELDYRSLKEITVKTDRHGVAKVTWPVSGIEQGILRIQARHWYRKDAMVEDVMQVLVYNAKQQTTDDDVYFAWTSDGERRERRSPSERKNPHYQGAMILQQVIAQPGDRVKVLVTQRARAERSWVLVAGMNGTRIFKAPRATNFWMEVPIDPKESAGAVKVIYLAKDPFTRAVHFSEQLVYVDQPANDIDVKVKADKKSYRPGDVMKLEIQTENQGKGKSAVVEIGIVDEAIFRMKELELVDMRRFFRPLPFESEPILYGRGAFIIADYNVVSYPVLKNGVPVKERDSGGGGIFGDGGGGAEPEGDVRQRAIFKDTIYYRATATTDENGQLKIEVPTPDDLTQWRITVRAHAEDQYFGHQISQAITTQPVSVRMIASRFYVEGDQAILRASVANMTKKSGRFKITLKLEGAQQKYLEEYRVVNIDPGKTFPLEWPITISDQGEMKATVRAVSELGSDEIMITRPVKYNAVSRAVAGAELMKRQWSKTIKIGDPQPFEVGDLVLVTSQANRRELLTALPYLVAYPYGCVEQTMSRFLPALVVKQQMKDLKVDGKDYGEKLPEIYQKSIDKLYGFQHEDGGWGWWAYDDTNLWMSAYVMWGLLEAQAAGYEVPEAMFSGGLSYLARTSGWQAKSVKPGLWIPHKAVSSDELPSLALYVLARATDHRPSIRLRLSPSLAKRIPVQMLDGDNAPKVLKVGGLQLSGIKRVSVKVNNISELAWLVLAGYSDLAKYLPEQPVATKGRGTTNRRNALILMAHHQVNPGSDAVQYYIHDLLSKRRGPAWQSTLDTAYAVMVLGRVLPDREPVPLKLTMNGKTQVLESRMTQIPYSQFKKQTMKISLAAEDDLPIYVSWQLPYLSRRLPKAALADRDYREIYEEGEQLRAITVRWYEADDDYEDIDPEAGIAVGDILMMRVAMYTERNFGQGLLEIPIPAGLEPVLDDQLESDNFWGFRPVVKDDRVLIPMSGHRHREHISVRFRATQPGTFNTPPSHVFDMYNPGIRLYGAPMKMVIRR